MSEDASQLEVLFSDEFKERLRSLSKRYRHIQSDLQPLIDNLQSNTFIGDQIPGTGYTVFKIRLKNTDIQKGKSAGYRVIYQIKDSTCVLLVTIYSKSEQSTIAVDKIQEIIAVFEATDA